MTVEKLSDLKGYAGVYSEVAVHDCYHLRELAFVPDVIFDLGANVGCFARHAHELFPNAIVVCVEPDFDNFDNLRKFTYGGRTDGWHFYNDAVGAGTVYEQRDKPDGSHACFLSPGLGYPSEAMAADLNLLKTKMQPVSFSVLYAKHVQPGQRVLVKMDIEGNEHTVFTHEPSMEALRKCDYVAIEVHRYALKGELIDEVHKVTNAALATFNDTHLTNWEHVLFFARKWQEPTPDYYQRILGGFCDYHDFYATVAAQLPVTCQVVEVGCAYGESGIYLAAQLRQWEKNARITLIDNLEYGGQQQRAQILSHIAESGSRNVELVVADSLMASRDFADQSLDMVFVDGNHTFEFTVADVRLYKHKVKDHGVFAGHDYLLAPSVRQAVHSEFYTEYIKEFPTAKGYGVWSVDLAAARADS